MALSGVLGGLSGATVRDIVSIIFGTCDYISDALVHATLLEANTRVIQRHLNSEMEVATSETRRLHADKNSGFTGFRRH
jgi:hypothetical protein